MTTSRRKAAGQWRQASLLTPHTPHVLSGASTRGVMSDVLIALLPALAVAVYFFGPRAAVLAAVSAAAAVASEVLMRLILKRPLRAAFDLSAVVTGILLAMCLPVSAPYWMAAAGACFAVVVVKQLYGGIGKNLFNPALAGRVFLLSFPALMRLFAAPGGPSRWVSWTAGGVDAIASATPLAALHAGLLPTEISLHQMLIGQRGGSMGETAAFALLLGGAYLILRRVITSHIPLSFLGTVAGLTYLFPRGNDPFEWMLFQLTAGGLLLAAFFMATDYTTSPTSPWGQVVYGAGCGGLTVLLRYFGAHPEGVGFAILIMNALVPVLDRIGLPRRYGTSLFPRRKREGANGQ